MFYLQEEQKKVADCTLKDKCSDLSDIKKISLQSKKILKGHLNKVNSIHFAGDSRYTIPNKISHKIIIKEIDKKISDIV